MLSTLCVKGDTGIYAVNIMRIRTYRYLCCQHYAYKEIQVSMLSTLYVEGDTGIYAVNIMRRRRYRYLCCQHV